MSAREADPYGAHRFRVSCDVLPVMGFAEVRGLSVETVVSEPDGSGGPDDPTAGRREWWDWRTWIDRPTEGIAAARRVSRSPRLELRRGMTDERALWNWFRDWVSGNVTPQDLRICLLDNRGRPARGWVCRAATPVRWIGPDLVADRATVAMETLELIHEGIDGIDSLDECVEPA